MTEPMYAYYEHVSDRRRSFARYGWPGDGTVVNTVELAIFGFFYTGAADVTICFHCGVALSGWGDSRADALREHLYWSSECAYARKYEYLHSNAFSLLRWERRRSLPRLDQQRSYRPSTRPALARSCSRYCNIRDRFADAAAQLHRDEMDSLLIVDQFEQTRAVNERLICRMRRFYDTSKVLLETLRYARVEDAMLAYREFNELLRKWTSLRDEYVVVSVDLEEDEAEERDVESVEDCAACRARNCIVCMSDAATVLFLPCRHTVSCRSCAARLRQCPVCRSSVWFKIRCLW